MPTQAVPSADIRTVFLVIIRLYKSGKTNYIGVHIGVYQPLYSAPKVTPLI